MRLTRAAAWFVCACGIIGHIVGAMSDAQSTYHVAVACFLLLSSLQKQVVK